MATDPDAANNEVWAVTDLWDRVKSTADQAKYELYLDNWSLMIRIQAQMRGLLARARKRKAAEEEQSAKRALLG